MRLPMCTTKNPSSHNTTRTTIISSSIVSLLPLRSEAANQPRATVLYRCYAIEPPRVANNAQN